MLVVSTRVVVTRCRRFALSRGVGGLRFAPPINTLTQTSLATVEFKASLSTGNG